MSAITDKRGIPLTIKPVGGQPYKVNQWLLTNARDVAKQIDDDYNLTRFKNLVAANLTSGDKNDLNYYLFGAF